jgi:3-hydroxybutyryl-CoA dehydrogenase
MTVSLENTNVLIVGAGIMGSGIAQVAAQAGHAVVLFDAEPSAAATAKSRLVAVFEKLVAKDKFSEQVSAKILSLIEPIESLDEAANVGLVVEAIIEDIEIKRSLLQQLEDIVNQDCVLATNTSSISITAIANGMRHPERLVGMHFFNPVALMKLVEVVSGLQTSPAVAESIFKLAESWGKVAVNARSTPGFIVNRIARSFYAETLALLQEQAATPAVLDSCLRAAGFRMGPCELMDLIGHDTNLAVTRSVYAANFYDKRFAPSMVQQELVDGGLLGRKSGRGFYDYSRPAETAATEFVAPAALPSVDSLSVHGSGSVADRFTRALEEQDCDFERIETSDWCGLQVAAAQLRLTDGRTASQLGVDVTVFDLPLTDDTGSVLAWSHSANASEQWIEDAAQWLKVFGFQPQRIADAPGLVVARTIAMLINEAADAVQQGVCTETDADAAMKLGVNYPAGPFEWLANWDAKAVIELLDNMDTYYRGERYRVSPWLRQQGWRGPAE